MDPFGPDTFWILFGSDPTRPVLDPFPDPFWIRFGSDPTRPVSDPFGSDTFRPDTFQINFERPDTTERFGSGPPIWTTLLGELKGFDYSD